MLPQLAFVLLCFFSANDFHVEGTLSATSITRTHRIQSRGPLTSYRSGSNLKTHTRSGSESSGSSLTEQQTAADSQPIASTSTGKKIDSTDFNEVDLQPLVEKQKRTSFINSVNLNEASVSTHSINGNINPAIHGVYARVRSAMLRYGSAVAIGSAVGVGGLEVNKKFFPDYNNNNNITQVNDTQVINIEKNQKSVNNVTPDSDGIINLIG